MSNAQVRTKFQVVVGIFVHFISLEVLFGAFENLSISPSWEVLMEWNNLKIQHENLRNGSILGFLKK